MRVKNKLFKVISLMLIATMLIPADLAFAKNKTFKTFVIDEDKETNFYKATSNLKVGDTNTYRFKINGNSRKGKSKMLMTFQSADADAYSITLRDNKNKVIASNNSCNKIWTKKFTMSEKVTYKVEVKALKESAFTLDIVIGYKESYTITNYGKKKEFTIFDMGQVGRIEGSYITAPVSGGKWIQMHHTNYVGHEKFETVGKSRKYKITKNSPKDRECIYYLKDGYLYEYGLEDVQFDDDRICDEIYFYIGYSPEIDFYYVNPSDKTIKKIVIYGEDSDEKNCKISIPMVMFSGKLGQSTTSKEITIVKSVKIVYTDDSSKVYDDLDYELEFSGSWLGW